MVESVQLGVWVSQQRQLYKDFRNGRTSASISDERIAELNAIGFDWKPMELSTITGRWREKFDRLCDFQREYRHCRVPQRFVVESVQLGLWVSKQRQLYKDFRNGKTSASISDERIAELNAIGFEW